MTIGIYSIYWEKPDLIYIGQSEDIERRWKTHIRELSSNTHCNHKMQNVYNTYGEPFYSILEVCNRETLLAKEAYWASEFDNLLNIQEPGTIAGSGLQNGNSKLSKFRILRVFSLLKNTNLSTLKISTKLNVTCSTIDHIKYGETHKWLQEDYPEAFQQMLNNRNTVKYDTKNLRSNSLRVISPDKVIFEVLNLSRFARDNNPYTIKWESFNRGLVKCMSDSSYSYKGWKIEKE